ncbi:acyl-CoA dehydrogenase family protein [Luteolibacter ambystomatis]|uniref:Acyl-CoA dehydrogenase family protein n=1 Tax=Luteolibacter ambystomatis TaxID=2824561 RepID=A0A975G626_9BACT|nr:acyl-CoA dehydrogenase family protein [Luteolibacter ambystomatis]QUE49764.1 acyl-CoA dehydrogenase family protein [Luteolibacter ambystomatis]
MSLDTSKMSSGQRAAMELAESSRDTRELSGFAASIFDGKADFSLACPFPMQPQEDRTQGDAFLDLLRDFLKHHTDPDAIDRDGEIPQEVFDGLARLGAFGIKIPTEYGGLGLSQTNYSRAAMVLGGHCGNLTALLSAHQSIGIPQPLLMFGSEEQKRKYLPRCAHGGVSAFALTEHDVGSDPARMKTEARREGDHYILNGEKLWCTNGLKAGHMIVMAKTPTPEKPGAITAFIVETDMPGVEIVTRCRFMGLKALYNGIIRFTNVRIPAENIVLGEGKGLKVALSTLNTGRLTLPAACAGMMYRLLDISRRWCSTREQWGQVIGKHAAIAAKLADIAADAFATEALVRYASALVDADHSADIRLEAALAKLWGTEAGWRAADQTLQLRGGRGFETADSLRNRGEAPEPVERFLRDSRINTIFEGSTEIMHLFIAREMLDPHLRRGADAIDSRKPMGERLSVAAKAGVFYAGWYAERLLPLHSALPHDLDPKLRYHLRKTASLSRSLSRAIFHAMILNGPKLEKKQMLLARLVDAGAELLAMSCACGYAHAVKDDSTHPLTGKVIATADYICTRGALRVNALLHAHAEEADSRGYSLAKSLLSS